MPEARPLWLVACAWLSVASGLIAAVAILVDILNGHRQHMRIMEVTWPVTGLYMGPLAWWAYWKFGRATKPGERPASNEHSRKPFWQGVFVSVTHCGGGCTLGDIISDNLIFLVGIVIAGSSLFTSCLLDFAAAYVLGIIFQYLPIREMGETDRKRALIRAIKADTLSLIAFEIGLFGWMAVVQKIIFVHAPQPDNPVFWFMMQIGMVVGFITAYPANWWLVRKGIKHAM